MSFFLLRVSLFALIPILYVIGQGFVQSGVPAGTVDVVTVTVFLIIAVLAFNRYLFGR